MDDLLFDARQATRNLTQEEIDWLVKTNGVPVLSLAHDAGEYGFTVTVAQAVFDGPRFDFATDDDVGVKALVIAARDREGEVVDLVAWQPRDGLIATMFGRTGILGEQVLYEPCAREPIQVCPTPLEWLQAGRVGIVIVEPAKAARALIDAPARLAVLDHAAAKNLAAVMTRSCRLDRIVVPAQRAA